MKPPPALNTFCKPAADINRHERELMCERKKWYRTRAKAEAAILTMAQYAYQCPYCDGWHLATKK